MKNIFIRNIYKKERL